MLKACVECGTPSGQARCPKCRYTRPRGRRYRQQRTRVIQRDGYRCQACGKALVGNQDTHVDHIVPLAVQPGPRLDHELRTLCATCNMQKGAA